MASTMDKVRSQVFKDYVAWPAVSLPFGITSVVSSLAGSVVANIVRNLWAFAVIFCGHFPDGVEFFDPDDVEGETLGDYYRRQVLGSVNFTGGPVMDLMTGNLDHQIEHHLFPDMPSSRYAEIAPKVREICERHSVSYNTRSFARQLFTVVRKNIRLSRPST
jgi:linoleoyl-CoA desaturase